MSRCGPIGIRSEIYQMAKDHLRSRRRAKVKEKGSPGRHLGFTSYGPNGEELSKWDTREDDENGDARNRA